MKQSLLLCVLLSLGSSAAFASTMPNTICTDNNGSVAAANAAGQCGAGMSAAKKRANARSSAAPGESQGGAVAAVTTFKPAVTAKTIAASKATGPAGK